MSTKLVRRSLLAVFFANFIFGFSFPFTKITLEYLSPFVLLSTRFFIAFVAFSLILVFGKQSFSMKGKPWWLLILLGTLHPVIYFVGETYGVLYTSSGFSAIMIALIPIFSLFASALFLRESPTMAQSLFSALSVLGVLWISFSTHGGTNQIWGILLLLLAVIADVAFYLLSRKISTQFTSFERSYIMFIMGFFVFTIAMLFESGGSFQPFVAALTNTTVLPSLLYLGIISSVVAFYFLNYANTHLPVTRTIVFSNVTTLVSLLAGTFLLHEHLSPSAMVAAGMIVLGVWGVQRFARAETEN